MTKPQVITLKSDNKKLLDQLIDIEKAGELKGFIIAGFQKDGTILTGFSDTNVIEDHTLLSYLQVHITKKQVTGWLSQELRGDI